MLRKIGLLFILPLIFVPFWTIKAADLNNSAPGDQVVYYLQVIELDSHQVRSLGLEELELPERGFGVSYGEEIIKILSSGWPGLLRLIGTEEIKEVVSISRPRLETVMGQSAGINLTEDRYSYIDAEKFQSGIELLIEPVKKSGEEILSRISFSSYPRKAELETEVWVGPGWKPLGIVTRVFEFETASLLSLSTQKGERYLAFYVAARDPEKKKTDGQLIGVGDLDGLSSFLLKKDRPQRTGSIYGFLSHDGTLWHGGLDLDWWVGRGTVIQLDGWMGRDHRYSLGVEHEIAFESLRLGIHVKKVGMERPYLLALGVSDRVQLGNYFHLEAGYYPLMIDFYNRWIRTTYWWVGGVFSAKRFFISSRYLSMGETDEVNSRLGFSIDDPAAIAIDYRTDLNSFHAFGVGIWLDFNN